MCLDASTWGTGRPMNRSTAKAGVEGSAKAHLLYGGQGEQKGTLHKSRWGEMPSHGLIKRRREQGHGMSY